MRSEINKPMTNHYQSYPTRMLHSLQLYPLHTLQQAEEYYQEVMACVSGNTIQDISHKSIRMHKQQLERLAVEKHFEREERKRLDRLTKVYMLLDAKYQRAIKQCILKKEFESDLRAALYASNLQDSIGDVVMEEGERDVSMEASMDNKSNKLTNQPRSIIRTLESQVLPDLPPLGVFKKMDPPHLPNKRHSRVPSFKEEQISRKQKLIEDLLQQNMKLRQQGTSTTVSRKDDQKRSRIQEYIDSNRLLIQENQEIHQKLEKLEAVVGALTRQNKEEGRRVEERRVKDNRVEEKRVEEKRLMPQQPKVMSKKESMRSKQSTSIKDLFLRESPRTSKKQTVINNDFWEYFTERDVLQRTRDHIYVLPLAVNDTKNPHSKTQQPTPRSPSRVTQSFNPFNTEFQSAVSRYKLPSHSDYASLSTIPVLMHLESDVMEPDIRHYTLPRNKKASETSIPEEERQSQEGLQLESMRESVDLRRRQMTDFDNVSFESFQTVTSKSNSRRDDDFMISSRQNTRIQNSTRLNSISKATLIRNKVAFFKNSLILVKDDMSLEVGIKKSQLNREMDCIRVTIYLTNRLQTQQSVNISYEYDGNAFEIITNQKLQTLEPNAQCQEDITIYYRGKLPLTFITAKIQLEEAQLDFVIPVLFFTFREGLHRLDPNEVKTITLLPEKQFASPRFLHSILPLAYINQHEEVEYRRGQKSYIAECTLMSKKTIQGLRLEWTNYVVKLTCDKGFVDALAWILSDIQS